MQIRTAPPTTEKLNTLLSVMKPGTGYALTELMQLTGMRLSPLRTLLTRAMSDCLVSYKRIKDDRLYTRLEMSDVIDQSSTESTPPPQWSELKGYDTQWKQLRALCETTRRR